MSRLIRWARAFARAVARDGVWVYAPPLVISAASPLWRAAPPPRIAEEPAPAPATATDPQSVAARRAGLRLIIGFQSLT
ncbi:MAG TPA: hypothetical protein VFW47_07770 [Phenylobacterium sp.]|nr:hypothetical protein [Phenylobacterium sp.]